MARRSASNVIGDLGELKITELLLEHGFAVNSLTSSDTGWDLHCHLPVDLIMNASSGGKATWDMSGQTAHIQVKAGRPGVLRVGTVRGWVMGSKVGAPTFLFGMFHDNPVFSAPHALEDWLLEAEAHTPDDKDHGYSYQGVGTIKSTPLARENYRPERFPSVALMWSYYPAVAASMPDLTPWMNGSSKESSPLERMVQELACGLWADRGYSRYTDTRDLLPPLVELYEAAGFNDPHDRAEQFLGDPEFQAMGAGDPHFSTTSMTHSLVAFLPSRSGRDAGSDLLRDLYGWHSMDAEAPSVTQ